MFITRLLCGVPKFKTPKPKKVTRKFNSSRLMKPIGDLTRCAACDSVHHISTICLNCYHDVRVETAEIKRQMMNYNPYLGERQKPVERSAPTDAAAVESTKKEDDVQAI